MIMQYMQYINIMILESTPPPHRKVASGWHSDSRFCRNGLSCSMMIYPSAR